MASTTTMAKAKTKPKSNQKDQAKPTRLIPAQHDKPKKVALAGLVGLVLTYFVASRALNTGSYWEYLLTVILLVISIRLFIRSIRLK